MDSRISTLASFSSDVKGALDSFFTKYYGIPNCDVHLQNFRNRKVQCAVHTLISGCAFSHFGFSYDENLLYSFYKDGKITDNNYGNFTAWSMDFLKQSFELPWKKVRTKNPVNYVLRNCRGNALYLIDAYNGSIKVNAKDYIPVLSKACSVRHVGYGSRSSVQVSDIQLYKDRFGNIGIKQTLEVYD